jgi:beta-glucosidase
MASRPAGLRAEAVLSRVVGTLALGVALALPVAASSSREDADRQAAALVAQLTLEEKVDQLLNVAPAIPRLGIPAYNWWTESLHGAIGAVPTTNFPEPVGLAATFDAPLLHDVAATISVEVRGLHALGRATGRLGRIGTGLDTWSPNINIFRDPRWGRGQETYGEDPFLTARLAVAFVRGMQGPDPDHPQVIASPKHFAVHSGPESTRHEANVFVTPHDLEDTYLPAFRAAIVDAHAGSIMCAYNRVDGQPACANELLLKERLRGAWKFNGYVVSDCDAVKDISDNHKYAPDAAAAAAVALKTGVDNECNTATLYDIGGLGNRYREAYERGLIAMEDIDRALVRLFSARYRNGDLAGEASKPRAASSILPLTSPQHDALALKTAEKSLVLLKNDGVLPLAAGKRVLVVGPHADSTRVLRGNYSSSLSSPPISIVAGLRQALPRSTITQVPWAASITDGDPVPTSALRTPDGKPGLRVQYFDAEGEVPKHFASREEVARINAAMKFRDKPTVSRVEPGVGGRGYDLSQLSDHYRVEWTGFLVPPESGTYRLGMRGFSGELTFDRKPLTGSAQPFDGTPSPLSVVTLEKGHRYPLRVSTVTHGGMGGASLLWKRISMQPEQDLASAAAQADVVVAAVGLTSDLEGEEMKIDLEGFSGGDRTSLDLPGNQRKLLEQVKATGKPLVVVLLNGSPINLAWAKENAAAIIEAWYPGQAGGLAVANVISGKTNPAGRLPLTFYQSVADLPPFGDYSMRGRTYRYYTGTPVYPFGYGLSYAKFEYGSVRVEGVSGDLENGVRVTTTVTNTSKRAGEEVAQLYLEPPKFDGAPRLALRGFQRFTLQPGERRTIALELSPRDLSFVNRDGRRQLMAGEHRVSVGSGQPGTGVPSQSTTFSLSREVVLPE